MILFESIIEIHEVLLTYLLTLTEDASSRSIEKLLAWPKSIV